MIQPTKQEEMFPNHMFVKALVPKNITKNDSYSIIGKLSNF